MFRHIFNAIVGAALCTFEVQEAAYVNENKKATHINKIWNKLFSSRYWLQLTIFLSFGQTLMQLSNSKEVERTGKQIQHGWNAWLPAPERRALIRLLTLRTNLKLWVC